MDTAKLIESLVGFAPVTENVEAVNRTVDFLTTYMTENGLYTKVETLNNRKILYAGTRPGTAPDVLLNAHLDVVPGDSSQFNVQYRDNHIIGRGAHDCLANCAVAANVAIAVKDTADVGVIFSTDEEQGGSTTKAMVDKGYTAKKLIIVLDGRGYAVIVAQKGILSLRLEARGTGGHAAAPWRCDNAIDRLIDGYQRIRSIFPAVQPPDEWHNTLAATVIQGGETHNRIPDAAAMTVNIRYTEDTDAEALLARIEEQSRLKVTCSMRCEPVFCDPESTAVQAFITHMRSAINQQIEIVRNNGATDMRHFKSTGIPMINISVPGHGDHGADEYAELDGIETYERMLCTFLKGDIASD